MIAMGLGWTLGAILPFALPGLGRFAYFPNAVTFALWGIGIGVVTLYPLRKLLREA